jgi:hypothetical protein
MAQGPLRQGWRVVGKPLQLSIPVDLEALARALPLAEERAYDDDWPVDVEVRLGRLEDGLLVAVQRESTVSLMECRSLGENRTAVSLWVRSGPTSEGLQRLLEALVRLVPEAVMVVAEAKGRKRDRPSRPYGPTEKILELAEEARAMKEKDPTMSQAQIAEALGISVNTVRYIWRITGQTWERADRVRRPV